MNDAQLHLDFETRSTVNIRDEGVDKYCRNAEVLMLAWAFDDEEPELWFPGTPMPDRLERGLMLPHVVKVAWNARFEYLIFKHALKKRIPLAQWRDPAVYARHATIPNSLLDASMYLDLGEFTKHESGKALIRWFCVPKKDGTFRDPKDYPEKWQQFCDYCKQDVRAERAVDNKLQRMFELTPFEKEVALIDGMINERGMPVDMAFVSNAQKLVLDEKVELRARLKEITGLDNPNSGKQMLPWLQAHGYPYSSLLKKRVDIALKKNVLDSVAIDVISLRHKLTRTSTSKLDAITSRVADDGRLRYSYKYLGANRTGRWSGEGVQLQNLPR